MKLKNLATLLMVSFLTVSASPIWACSVCFGDPNSSMVKGAKAGIIFLAIMIYGLLMGMGGVVAFWVYRAKKLAATNAVNSVSPTVAS